MLEALWSAEFSSSLQHIGNGVVVFETGRIFGGDGQYYYTGTYDVHDGKMTGEVTVTHYAGQPWSIFGDLRSFRLVMSGVLEQNSFTAQGHLADHPNLTIDVRLGRLAELP